MPFTLAHPAATLPITRGRLVPSALVLGSMAPDLQYYFPYRLPWIDSQPWSDGNLLSLTRTHHVSSVFWLDPLIALVLLSVFHLLLKRPMVTLLPKAAAGRLWPSLERFPRRRVDAVGWIVLSAVIGAATHLAWDSLDDVFGESHSPQVDVVSGVLGLAVILGWVWRWWQVTPSQPIPAALRLVARLRTVVLGLLVVVPLLVGTVGAGRFVQELIVEGRRDRQTVVPSILVHPPLSRMDYAEVGLRTFVADAVKAVVVMLAVYAVGWYLSRFATGRRGSTEPGPEDRD